jgi:tetratricopeptide (TPR) repeat protein
VSGSGSSVTEHRDIFLRSNRETDPRRSADSVFVQDVPETARRTFELAVRAFDQGRTGEGVRLLTAAVEDFPEYFVALERLGLEFLKQSNFNYARAVYTKAVSVNERCFWCWYGLGVSAREQGLYEIAVEAAGRAVILNTASLEAALFLGVVQRLKKDYAGAEKTLVKARSFKSPDVHWNLALLYGNDLKRYREAADELDRYLELLPKDADRSSVEKLIKRFREMSQKK